MEIIEKYTQQAQFAVMTKFKNYSKISEKWIVNSIDDFDKTNDLDDIFSVKQIDSSKDDSKHAYTHIKYVLPEKDGKPLRFFYGDDSTKFERLKFFYEMIDGKNITTTQDSDIIKKNLPDPFVSMYLYLIERSVTVFEKKITLKYDVYIKKRRFNNRYATKESSTVIVTVNTQNGMFYLVHKTKKGRKKTLNIKKNDFTMLNAVLNNIIDVKPHEVVKNNNKLKNEIEDRFNNEAILKYFDDKLKEYIGETPSYLPSKNLRGNSIDNTHVNICEFFAVKRKIKLPNDYMYWLSYVYPTEKYLKKNDRKLISASLDMVGLKNKFNIKIFHMYSNIDVYNYKRITILLGDDYTKYLGNLTEKAFKATTDVDRKQNKFLTNNLRYNNVVDIDCKNVLTDVEKENLIKYLNSIKVDVFSNSTLNLITDHISMIKKIRSYEIDAFFNAKTEKEFHAEHLELSKIISAIRKGWVTQYIFNEHMVNDIETPLSYTIQPPKELENEKSETIKLVFYPYILKREEEYQEEGKFMHHCVATYTEKSKSIIISIRTEDKSDRVTCEFNCQDGRLIQARHFCNKQPPADMLLAVDELCNKTTKYARLGLLHALEHIKVPIVINGVEIKQKAPTPINTNFVDLLEF